MLLRMFNLKPYLIPIRKIQDFFFENQWGYHKIVLIMNTNNMNQFRTYEPSQAHTKYRKRFMVALQMIGQSFTRRMNGSCDVTIMVWK